MITERQQAAAIATAQKNNQHNKEYYSSSDMSSSKICQRFSEQLGELLLFLQMPLNQAQQENCWCLFEVRLREYLDLRLCKVVEQ